MTMKTTKTRMMNNLSVSALFIWLVASCFVHVSSERTRDKMYEKIEASGSCIRRLNSTHQTGCTSDQNGSTGVIQVVESLADLNVITSNGTAPPYVAVMPITMMTTAVLDELHRHQDRVSGVVFHKNVSRPTSFSHETRCPNDRYSYKNSCDSQHPWNPDGTQISRQDYPFPIFLLSEIRDLHKMRECFTKFNDFDHAGQHLRSLCSLELSSFMFATVDSQTCLRRSKSVTNITPTNFCDPLGDRNVWSTLFPWQNTTDRVSDVVLVTTRMDTTSMFNDVSQGAISPVTGLVTLLATAHLLKTMVADVHTYKKNVIFTLFNGESYDYIGSQRFVYDITQGRFPMEKDENVKHQVPALRPEDIHAMLEISQLGPGPIFMHHVDYKNQTSNMQVDELEQALKKYANVFNISMLASTTKELPPASLHSFLREWPELPAILLADHDLQFTNHHYNSIYDDADGLDYTYGNASTDHGVQAHIAKVALALASLLYNQVTGVNYSGQVEPPVQKVDELLHCYLDTANCDLYKAVTLKESIDEKPFSLYVGVVASGNVVTTLTGLLLAWLTGDVTNRTEANCVGDPHEPVYQYAWMARVLGDSNSTACYSTTMNFTLAVSPAFDLPEYPWRSGKYSTWTESVWRDISVRMFLKPSQRHEIMTVCVGTLTMILSLGLVYFVKLKSNVLFPRDVTLGPGTSC